MPENLKSSEIKWVSVWCRQFHVNFGDVFFPTEPKPAQVKVVDFSTLDHGLSGEVFVINENTLLVKSFSYDGLAPAATFLAGKSGEPGRDNSIIIPYPFDGKSYNYEDDAPILAEFNNEEIM